MAYGTKYRAGFSSKNITGYVYIDEDGFSGSVQDLILTAGSLSIRYTWGGWNNPILGLVASIEIVNNGSSFFDLLPLLTAEERQYRIRIERISPSALAMFTGFLNSETNEVTYLKNRPIRLNASSYVSKLQYLRPGILETLANETFINLINASLEMTGSADPIRVNSKLYPTGSALATGQSLYNRSGVFTEMFWKNNVDRDSALEIITKILTAFDCYLYHFSGSWFIERYEDIYNNPRTFVVYNSGASYGESDAGSTDSISSPVLDFVDMIVTGGSQTIQVETGYKSIEVKLRQSTFFNLTVNDFSAAADISGAVPYPNFRTWQKWNESPMVWSDLGKPWKNISNSIRRYGWAGSYDTHRGIYTRFALTKTATTSLTIKWKFATLKGVFGSWTGNWSDYTFKFKWYLRKPTGNDFIVYNAVSEAWEIQSGTEITRLQTLEISGDQFDDANVSTEISVSIPLGEISAISNGDHNFVLGIGTEIVSRSGVGDIPALVAYIGDVVITASADPDDNNYLAETGTRFLDKKEINLEIYDAGNLNIKNGILRGSSLSSRTTTWTTDGILQESLVRRLIRNKFQLFNRSRQRLTARLKYSGFLKPFSLFSDGNQVGKKFVLTGYAYKPDRDEYDIELAEYDNSETINFI